MKEEIKEIRKMKLREEKQTVKQQVGLGGDEDKKQRLVWNFK